MIRSNRLRIAPLCLAFGLSSAIMAQAPTAGQLQAGQQTASNKAEGLLSGDKPFQLSTDLTGELQYEFDDQTNELRKLTAKKGVIFTGDDLALNADQLEYDAVTGELVATGRRVVVRQGEILLTCQLFRYNPSTQQSELLGSPIIYNKAKDGRSNNTAGERIIIFKANGKTQVKVIGGGGRAPSLSSSGAPGQPAPTAAEAAGGKPAKSALVPDIGVR